jgi:hypothetical protein
MIEEKYSIDFSELTASDVGDLLAADGGDIAAAQRLMEKVIKPSLDVVPLGEWNEARKAMVKAAVAEIFRTRE